MPVLVVEQRLLGLEILPASFTGIGLQIRVHSLMYDQVALALEPLAACGAAVVELSRVGRRVLGQSNFTAKRLLAHGALKGLFTRVLSHVLLQFVVGPVLLAAMRANLGRPFLPGR